MERLATPHKIKIRHLFRNAGSVVGDQNLLYRAFRNLLENAIVWGSTVGKKINYRKDVSVSFSVTSINNGSVTKIVIKDNGGGMDSKALAAAREIYANPTMLGRTSLAPGFGTMIVAFVISVHLGRVSLESKAGKGTSVCIEIPSH